LVLLKDEVFGTCHGLSKLPYFREGKRSIGINDYLLKINEITGVFDSTSKITGDEMYDRIALGAYNLDLHPMENCSYPEHLQGDL